MPKTPNSFFHRRAPNTQISALSKQAIKALLLSSEHPSLIHKYPGKVFTGRLRKAPLLSNVHGASAQYCITDT